MPSLSPQDMDEVNLDEYGEEHLELSLEEK